MNIRIGNGIDIHYKDCYGENAFRKALWSCDESIAKWLIDIGYKPNKPSPDIVRS